MLVINNNTIWNDTNVYGNIEEPEINKATQKSKKSIKKIINKAWQNIFIINKIPFEDT